MAKTDEERAKHRRRQNVKDIIRDEIYGADPSAGKYIVLDKSDVAKIAKQIMKRAAIGPL